MHPDALWS
jgi:hypothetical protein